MINYTKIYKAVTDKTVMNPLGNDLIRGVWCVHDHYQYDTSKAVYPCECEEVYHSLKRDIEYHHQNPNKTLYYSPKEVKFFGRKVDKKRFEADNPDTKAPDFFIMVPDTFECTTMCRPKSEQEILLHEVKNIVAYYRDGREYHSDVIFGLKDFDHDCGHRAIIRSW